MAGDDIERRARFKLESLQGHLVREHRMALAVLEDVIAALTCKEHGREDTIMCSERSSHKNPSEVCSSLGVCAARASVSPCPHAVYTHGDSTPPQMLSERPGSTQSSLETDLVSAFGFRVLDIWNKPLLRAPVLSGVRRSMASATSNDIDSVEADSDLKVRAREADPKRLMRLPSSMQYLLWEIMSFFCVAHDVLFIPLQVFGREKAVFMIFMSWLIRLFWTLDILLNFTTGYVTPKGSVELRPTKVAWHYLHTWFLFDLMLVGCDWVEAIITIHRGESESTDAAVLRLLGTLRAIRLIRLVRLANSQNLSEFIFERIRSEGVKLIAYIVSVILVLLCLVHVFACLWHIIHGEVEAVVPGADAHLLVAQYLFSFHHVLALFSGEHILEPRNLRERMFIVAVLTFAWVVSGAFVGSLTTAMTQLQVVASKHSTQFATLKRYLSDCGITRELAARVQRNARHALHEQNRYIPEGKVELMVLISKHLRSEIHYEVCSPMLTVHPFFRLYNSVNQGGMRHICHTSVSQTMLSRGDVLFSDGELAVAPTMFFVISGRFVYTQGDASQLYVEAKHWVAEAVLWTRWTHQGTLRALTECCVLALDSGRLASVMSNFPTCHGHKYAVKFVEHLNQVSSTGDLTDMPDSVECVRQRAADVFLEEDPRLRLPLDWTVRAPRRRSSIFSLLSSSNHPRITSVLPVDANETSEVY